MEQCSAKRMVQGSVPFSFHELSVCYQYITLQDTFATVTTTVLLCYYFSDRRQVTFYGE